MITIYTGKLFCELYNEENGTNLSAKEIFKTVIAPICFKDNRPLTVWRNTKFFSFTNSLPSGKVCLDDFDTALEGFCNKMESEKGGLMDLTKVYGGCALPYDSQRTVYTYAPNTTAFCFCENVYYDIEERYCSWIGSMFMINLTGMSLVVEDKDFISTMWESMKAYREFLNINTIVKGGQLDSWNTIYFFLKKKYPERLSNIFNEFSKPVKEPKNNYTMELSSAGITFENIIFTLAKFYKNVKYIQLQSFANINKTCGAILFNVNGIRKMSDVFEKLYAEIGENFDAFDFSKTFCSNGNLTYKAIQNGAINEKFFDPLYDIDFKTLSKNKKIFVKYIEIVMDNKMKEAAVSLAGIIKRVQKKSRNNVVFNDSVKTKAGFLESIYEFIKTYGLEKEEFMDIIECIASCNSAEDFNMFVPYFKIQSL